MNTTPLNSTMGTSVTLQVVERQGGPQYTFTVPRPLAEAMNFHKGEVVEMSIEGNKLVLQRKLVKRLEVFEKNIKTKKQTRKELGF